MSYGLMTLPNHSNEKFSFKFPNPTFYNPKKKKKKHNPLVSYCLSCLKNPT